MGTTAANNEADSEKKYPPLFPEPNDNGKNIYADDILKVVVYRQFPGFGGKSRRIKMSKSEFKLQDGSTYVINPFSTDEDELEEVFGGGEYYLQPFGHDGARLPCARTIILPGAMKAGVEKTYLHQTMFGGSKIDDEEAEKNNVADANMMTIFQQMLADSNKRADALAERMQAQQFAANSKPSSDQEELVRSLRVQLDSLIANHRAEMDEKSKWAMGEIEAKSKSSAAEIEARTKSSAAEVEAKTKLLEEERASMRKTIEGSQEEYNSKRRFLENELQLARAARDTEIQQARATREMEVARDRGAHEDEIRRLRDEHRNAIQEERKLTDAERLRVGEERKRADELVMEERKKRNVEVEDVQRRLQGRVNDLEREVSEMRVKHAKQLTEEMKENISLRKDLADTPLPIEPPPPPSNNRDGDGTNKDDPWFYRALNTWGPPLAKAVGEYAKTAQAAQAAQPQQPVQQIQPPRFQPQQQQYQPEWQPPAQQFVPQPQYQQPPQPQFVPQPNPVQQPAQQPVAPVPTQPEPFVPPRVPFDPNVTYGPSMTFGEGEEPMFAQASTGEQIEGGGWVGDVVEDEVAAAG